MSGRLEVNPVSDIASESGATPADPEIEAQVLQSDDPAGVSHSVAPPSAHDATLGTKLKRLAVILAPLGLLGALIVMDISVCPMKNLFGIPCPGCGMTRATEALVTGDLMQMLRFHPLAPILAPLAIFSVVRAVLVSAGFIDRRSPDPLGKVPGWFWVLLGVALIGIWVARIFGYLGGHPDPIAPEDGYLWGGVQWIGRAIGLL